MKWQAGLCEPYGSDKEVLCEEFVRTWSSYVTETTESVKVILTFTSRMLMLIKVKIMSFLIIIQWNSSISLMFHMTKHSYDSI